MLSGSCTSFQHMDLFSQLYHVECNIHRAVLSMFFVVCEDHGWWYIAPICVSLIVYWVLIWAKCLLIFHSLSSTWRDRSLVSLLRIVLISWEIYRHIPACMWKGLSQTFLHLNDSSDSPWQYIQNWQLYPRHSYCK